LPPGSGGRQGFGTGLGAAERPVQLLWGLTRHEWGDIHYWTAIVLMSVLALHLLLHWKWIVGVIRGKPTTASPYRLALGAVGLVSAVVLAAIPLAGTTTTATRHELQRADRTTEENAANIPDAEEGTRSIRGSMSLQEIAAATGTTVEQIVRALDLPTDTDPNERAGRLLRRQGLEMSDLRQSLSRLSDSKTNAATDE
jgi:hypothetical protein